MKQKMVKPLLMVLLSIFGLSNMGMHKFYLSLTEINFKPDKATIEITIRVFPDDLDFALKNKHGKNPQIASTMEIPTAEEWLTNYLKESFIISIDDTEIPYTFLGKMMDGDAMMCFLEAAYDQLPHKVTVQNNILCDFFKDQKNIVQLYYKEQNLSMLLDKNKISSSISFD